MRADIGARVGEGRRGEQRQSEHGARVTTFGGVPGDRRGIGPVHRSVDDGRRVTGVADKGEAVRAALILGFVGCGVFDDWAADQTILAVVGRLIGHNAQRQGDLEETFALMPVDIGMEIKRVRTRAQRDGGGDNGVIVGGAHANSCRTVFGIDRFD